MEKRIVHTTSLFEVDDEFVDDRFMKVRVTAMHSGINRNNSCFSIDVIKAAQDTFSNIPILADIQEVTDANGNKHLDYTSHSMHIEQDAFDENSQRIIYDEKVVGIVPETNNFEIVHDDETGNDYALVDALLFRDYGNYCCNILEERGGKTDVSAEIACEDVAYNSKEKCLDVGKMRMCAITLLGDAVTPGMAKAHAEVFSSSEDVRQTQLFEIMQELKESLDKYNNLRKEEYAEVENEKELLEEVTEILEEVVTETEETTEDEVTVEEEISEDTTEETPDTEEETVEESEEVETVEEEPEAKAEFSVTVNGETKTFSVSLNDKLSAMYNLIAETYSELDNEWYDINMYDDEKVVEMYGYFTGRNYRQAYKVKKDNYSLVGDRVEIYRKYMSQDEINAFEKMKADFAIASERLDEVSDKLAKYEAEPEKMEILNSNDYAQISESEDFIAFKEQSAHFDLTIDEVKAKADEMLLSYAKSGSLTFAANEIDHKEIKVMPIITEPKKVSRYGSLFSK